MIRRIAPVVFVVATLVTACNSLPAPVNVDLKARMGSSSQGSFQEPVTAGSNPTLDVKWPTPTGQCIDFSDQKIPANLVSAQVHYKVHVSYAGPTLTGQVQAKLYAASAPGGLWLASNQLGPTVTVDLGSSSTSLAGTVVLNKDQVAAVNARYVCWGVHLAGSNVDATGTGTATIGYTVDQLTVHAGVSVVPLSQR